MIEHYQITSDEGIEKKYAALNPNVPEWGAFKSYAGDVYKIKPRKQKIFYELYKLYIIKQYNKAQ